MSPIAQPAWQATPSMTRCPVSAPMPSALHTADWPGVTTRVDVGPAGRVVGGAVCAWVGGAVGGEVGAGAAGNVGSTVGGCVGGGVAWVGSGSGAAVVAGGAVDVGWPLVVGGATRRGRVRRDPRDRLLRGRITRVGARRRHDHDEDGRGASTSPASNVGLGAHSHASSIGEAAVLAKSSPKWCLVHCGAVPSKRLIVLTGLAVVAGGAGGDVGSWRRRRWRPAAPRTVARSSAGRRCVDAVVEPAVDSGRRRHL